MKAYPKQVLLIDEQMETFKRGHLNITDETELRAALTDIGFFRLRGYFDPYYNHSEKRYCANISSHQILQLYRFDRALSTLLLGYLSDIEVALRARCIDAFIQHKDALIYLDATVFGNKEYYWKNLGKITNEIERSSEHFISHNFTNHDGQVPVWAVFEVMTFGTLSKLLNSLSMEQKRKRNPKRKPSFTPEGKVIYNHLSAFYSYPSAKAHKDILLISPSHDYFASWVHAISVFRNICAHNSRIYRRQLDIKPKLLEQDTSRYSFISGKQSVFEILLAMKYLRPDNPSWIEFTDKLDDLLVTYQTAVTIEQLRFPQNWKYILTSPK